MRYYISVTEEGRSVLLGGRVEVTKVGTQYPCREVRFLTYKTKEFDEFREMMYDIDEVGELGLYLIIDLVKRKFQDGF